jgi:hypothetical protein
MTRRNDKRNNQPELPPFAQMLFGAILGKGAEMIANKMKEKDENTPSIHTEGITDKDIQNINEGNASLSKLYIPNDGTAIEFPIPENLKFFFNEEGKLMVRKKQDGESALDEETQEKPITYDDVLKELFLDKIASWVGISKIYTATVGEANYNDINNCTSYAQAKRLLAFNKLMNIAKYLNGEWMPNFDGNNKNWFIRIENGKYVARFNKWFNNGSVYFKSEEAANEAIRLMGEDSLNNLFSTDW